MFSNELQNFTTRPLTNLLGFLGINELIIWRSDLKLIFPLFAFYQSQFYFTSFD